MPAAEKMLSAWREEIARIENREKERCIKRLSEILDFNEKMLNTSSVGILTYKASGKCVFANRAAGEIVGTTAEKLMEQNFHRIKSWKKSGMYGAALRALEATEEQRLDSHIISTFGKDVWLRNRFSHFVSAGEKHLLLFISEITGLKKSEASLRSAEERYHGIFSNADNCIVVYAAMDGGRDFIITEFNAAAENVEKIRKGRVIGKKVTEVFPGVKEYGIFDVFRRVWRTGKPEHFPAKIYRDQRIAGWRENYIYKLSSGEVVALYKDITKEKQAEEELKIAEEKYRTIVESATDQIFMLDKRLRVISANKRLAAYMCKPSKELLGMPITGMFPKETAERLARNCRHVLETGVGISGEERVCINGEEAYISISLNPVMDSQRHIVAVAGIIRDVTRTKGTEEALRESGEHYKSLFNNAPISLFEEDFSEVKRYLDRLRGRGITDLRKHFMRHPEEVITCAQMVRILDVNLATIKMFEGKTKQSILGNLSKLFVYESYSIFREEIIHLYKDRTPFRSEIATKTSRGKVLNTIVEVSIAPHHESNWKRVLVSVTDITELKKAQEDIKKNKEELERLSEAAVGMEMEVIEVRRKLKKMESEKSQ